MRRVKAVLGRSGKDRAVVASNRSFHATWNGVVLAEIDRTVVIEGSRYFPPQDVSGALRPIKARRAGAQRPSWRGRR